MPDKETGQNALIAYHVDRIVSKFNLVISAENAELLAVLLGIDEDGKGHAA
jgi:hypothetical protein